MHPERMKPKKKLRGGVHVSDEKHTRDMPTKRIPAPEAVTLHMRQHIGAPCVPTVKVGDTVIVVTTLRGLHDIRDILKE